MSTKRPGYQAQIRIKGYPSESRTFSTKAEARRWKAERIKELKSSQHVQKIHTLGELIERYKQDKLPHRGKDKATVGPQLDWWQGQLGHKPLKEITPVLLSSYRDKLLKVRRLGNATVIRYFASLSVCYSYAISDLGWTSENPVKATKKPKTPKGVERYLSEDERRSLLKACKNSRCNSLYTIVFIALSTGARRGEILGLKWQDIDFKARKMTFQKTKNGEKRSVPLSELVLKTIQEIKPPVCILTDFLFSYNTKNKTLNIESPFKTALKQARIENFRFHDLRHTAASYLVMSGADLLTTGRILGHKDPKMTARYAHLSADHLADAVERMNGMFS